MSDKLSSKGRGKITRIETTPNGETLIDMDFKPETKEDAESLKKIPDGQKVKVTVEDLTGRAITLAPVTPEIRKMSKYPSLLLNNMFTTDDTLKGYQGQLELFDEFSFGGLQDAKKALSKEDADKQLTAVITGKEVYQGLDFSINEQRVTGGICRLLDKQGASEEKPYIVLNNISELYEEILEKKTTKRHGHASKEFLGGEREDINEGLKELEETTRKIFIRTTKYDTKKKKNIYGLYMYKKPIIQVFRGIEDMTKEGLEAITEKDLETKGKVIIKIIPEFLRRYGDRFKLLPMDLSREIREKAGIKKAPKVIYDFILFLHNHKEDDIEIRRHRTTIIKELKLYEQLKKRGKKYVNALLFKCYNIAKTTGYLAGYKIDEPSRKHGLVDVFTLNPDKFYHLRGREGQKEAESKDGIKAITYDKG